MTDRGLFDQEPDALDRLLARRKDPETSKQAARHVSKTLGARMEAALALLKSMPGKTACEIEHAALVSDGRYRKRLNDLRLRGLARKGRTRKCTITGRNAATWWPNEKD